MLRSENKPNAGEFGYEQVAEFARIRRPSSYQQWLVAEFASIRRPSSKPNAGEFGYEQGVVAEFARIQRPSTSKPNAGEFGYEQGVAANGYHQPRPRRQGPGTSRHGVAPFVERELKAVLGDKWQDALADGGPRPTAGKKAQPLSLDRPAHPARRTVEPLERRFQPHPWPRRSGASSASCARSATAGRTTSLHQQRRLSRRSIASAGCCRRSRPPQAAEVEQMRMDLLRVQFDEQRRSEMRKTSFQPTEGKPQGGLKPWREVVTPHPDVSSGRYQQAEFAADLWQVYQNEGSDEYKHPTEFFRRTFLTEGLQAPAHRGLAALAGQGGDPVVELQTNFGGGKTHSELALYHLFSGTPAGELPGVEELVQGSRRARRRRACTAPCSSARRFRQASRTRSRTAPSVRTLWGEIAWQLGGKEGYKLVKEADETATNPGDALKELFNKYAPCLILIDEWVAYARQLHEGSNLPAGNVRHAVHLRPGDQRIGQGGQDSTLLVVSVPSSDIEIGGEWGQKALDRLKNAIGRVEASWRPASPDEGFEIVRRRLFQPLSNEKAKHRDAVARAFSDLYGSQQQEFPPECREADYERRIKMAYPIHPELFDRLYNDWSTLDKFQRTRGVLRLMAAVIHSLWNREDRNLLIMPATVPVDDTCRAVRADAVPGRPLGAGHRKGRGRGQLAAAGAGPRQSEPGPILGLPARGADDLPGFGARCSRPPTAASTTGR